MGYLLIHELAKDPSKLSPDGLNVELWVKNLAVLSGMLYPKSFYLGPMFQYVLNQVKGRESERAVEKGQRDGQGSCG